MQMIVQHFDGTLQLLNTILIKCDQMIRSYREYHEHFVERSEVEYAAKSGWYRMFNSPLHVNNTKFDLYLNWPLSQFKQDSRTISAIISKLVTIQSEVDNTFILSDEEVNVINKYMKIDVNEQMKKLSEQMNTIFNTADKD
jgi:hypothetical protein